MMAVMNMVGYRKQMLVIHWTPRMLGKQGFLSLEIEEVLLSCKHRLSFKLNSKHRVDYYAEVANLAFQIQANSD